MDQRFLNDEADDIRLYKAVINLEDQYSIWLADRPNPLGWRDAGKTGSKEEVLQFIGEVWTDMRPLCVRLHMKEQD